MILLEPAILDRMSNSMLPRDLDLTHLLDRRMKLLADPDRLLLRMAIKHRLSYREIGEAMGLSPGNVSRRLRRLLHRLRDPLVASLCSPGCPLSDEYRRIGVAYFLNDQPAVDLARARGVSERSLRGMIEYIRGWHRGITTGIKAARHHRIPDDD